MALAVSVVDAEQLGQLAVVLLMHVVEDTRACHLDLTETEIDGDRLGDVQEATVLSQREGESVERLENVRALMQVEHIACLERKRMGRRVISDCRGTRTLVAAA